MTTPTTDPEDNKAKAFFTGALLIGAGFAGLVVAGIVLGFDYLLHGEPHEREHLADQRAEDRRNRHADAVAWLKNDRLERNRHRQAVREWFAAAPETRGDKPDSGETLGRALGRVWNYLLVGVRRFKNGWDKGRDDARARRDGGSQQWWRRPDDEAAPTPDANSPAGGTEPAQPEPQADPETPPPGQDDVVDAEIVPDGPTPASREVVPVGEDPTAEPDSNLSEYEQRLADLEDERRRNGHRPEPAKPAHQ